MAVSQSTDPSPFLTFPPFPIPPPGVTIIAFKDFKPSGIQLNLALDTGPEQGELDGLGVPTVELRVKHGTDGSDDKEHKKKKKRKRNAFVATGEGGAQLQRPWWEVWAEGEHMRLGNYDMTAGTSDRLFQAAYDFSQGRPWPMVNDGLRNLWDQFRLYAGLLAHPVQPPTHRKTKGVILPDGMDVDADVDDDDNGLYSDEDMPPPEPPADAAPEELLDAPLEVDDEQARLDQILQDRQAKTEQRRADSMAAFLRDPAQNIRVFFSSHFRDVGLVWSELRCRDAPLLLSFYLKYLLRTGALVANLDGEELIKSVKEAIEVAEVAKTDLPATYKMAQQLPCPFSGGCVELWGTRCKTWQDLEREFGGKKVTAASRQADDPEDAKQPNVEEDKDEKEELFKKELEDSGVKIIDTSSDALMEQEMMEKTILEDNLDHETENIIPAKNENENVGWDKPTGPDATGETSWISPSLAGQHALESWGPEGVVPSIGPWTSTTHAASAVNANGDEATDAAESWGGFEPTSNPWKDDDAANALNWVQENRVSLLPLLGPSMFPHTHETGVVEWSTRRIVRVYPPASAPSKKAGAGSGGRQEMDDAEAVEEELDRRLAKVVLAPWLGWDKNAKSDITRPLILSKSKGKVIMPDTVTGDHANSGGRTSESSADAGQGDGDGEREEREDVQPHKPYEDEIVVLVEPSVLDKLVVGMGLGATWIQIVHQRRTEVSTARARTTAPGRYWYMEQVLHVLPSFHTEA